MKYSRSDVLRDLADFDDFAVTEKRTFEAGENFAFRLTFQTIQIADYMYFAAAARMRDIDPVRIVDESDSFIIVAPDIRNYDNIAFPALKAVDCGNS